MSKVVRENLDELSAKLAVTIEVTDYEPKFKSELSKYRKKVSMKGFRPGKTPLGIVKKMYGKAILGDIINDSLQTEISNYLSEENINILGQPLPTDDQSKIDFDVNNLADFNFNFEIGLAPEFDLKGISKDTELKEYAVTIPDSMIDEDLDAARKRVGERATTEEVIEDNDIVKFNAEELDGDKAKKNGWASTFTVLVNTIADESVKKELLTKKAGDTIRFDVNKLEKDKDEAYVRKYLLNVTDNDADVVIGANFEAKIEEVTRLVPAELNQAFFDKYFGEGVITSEKEARAKIEEEVSKFYSKQAESLLFRDLQDYLLDNNKLPLPDTFLKRWIMETNDNMDQDSIEKDYDGFAKNLQWSLIRSKVIKKYELEVNEEELLEGFKNRVRSYFGGYGDELVVLNTANRLMQDEKQVDQLYQELMADKIFKAAKENITVKPEKIEKDKFEEILTKAKEEAEAARIGSESAGKETEEVAESVE